MKLYVKWITSLTAMLAGMILLLGGCVAIEPRLTEADVNPMPPAGGSAMASVLPQSLDELTAHAPLIVIGEVGVVVQYLDSVVYGPDGALLAGGEAVGPPMPPTPATDFVVEVEQVLRDDGAVATGTPIILRMAGTATPEMKELTQATDYPFSYTGDRHLFLLAPNPDGESYGFYYGPWSRLIIEENRLYVSDGARQPLLFEGSEMPVELNELIEHLRASL